MPAKPIYVPVLKGKEGEFAALEELSADVKAQIMPLIEIPAVPYDYANERPAKDLDEHIRNIAQRIFRCWQSGPLYLDSPWFGEDEKISGGPLAIAAVLADCRKLGVNAVPVISRTSSAEYKNAAAEYSSLTDLGACIRLLVEDFEEDIDVDAEVEQLIRNFEGDAAKIDLLLDLEDLGADENRALLVARYVLSMAPNPSQWRRVIVAGASFPEDLSDVGAETIATLPRREWDVWRALQRKPAKLPRKDLVYGDYAIAHPIPKEIDPRVMLMSANIRYTASNWLVIKGRNVRHYGFDQYFELCKVLVGRAEYSGRDFSWGDRYIDDCAAGMIGPGNATTWRKVGTNHHLTLVARTLASSDVA
jgi:T4 beta protein